MVSLPDRPVDDDAVRPVQNEADARHLALVGDLRDPRERVDGGVRVVEGRLLHRQPHCQPPIHSVLQLLQYSLLVQPGGGVVLPPGLAQRFTLRQQIKFGIGLTWQSPTSFPRVYRRSARKLDANANPHAPAKVFDRAVVRVAAEEEDRLK